MANCVFGDCVPALVIRDWQTATNRRTGNFIAAGIYVRPGEGAPPKLVDVKRKCGEARLARYRTNLCKAVAGRDPRREGTGQACLRCDHLYNNYLTGEVGKA